MKKLLRIGLVVGAVWLLLMLMIVFAIIIVTGNPHYESKWLNVIANSYMGYIIVIIIIAFIAYMRELYELIKTFINIEQ